MKKTLFLMLSIFVLMATTVQAESIGYYGTTSTTDSYLWADSSYGDDEFISVTVNGCSNDFTLLEYENVSGTATYLTEQNGTTLPHTFYTSSTTAAIKLRSNDGGEVYLSSAETNNPNGSTITGDSPSSCTEPNTDSSTETSDHTDVVNAINDLKILNDKIDLKIYELKSINEQIRSTLSDISGKITITNDRLSTIITEIQTTNNKLDTVNQNLVQIDTSINEFHSEFETNNSYSPGTVRDNSNLLDSLEPTQPTTAYTDSNTYFTDQGNAPSSEMPGPLPTAPEPEDWDGVTREPQMTEELEQTKDTELNKDTQKTSSPELTKDTEKVEDTEKTADTEKTQNHIYTKDETTHSLRWDSDQYP